MFVGSRRLALLQWYFLFFIVGPRLGKFIIFVMPPFGNKLENPASVQVRFTLGRQRGTVDEAEGTQSWCTVLGFGFRLTLRAFSVMWSYLLHYSGMAQGAKLEIPWLMHVCV